MRTIASALGVRTLVRLSCLLLTGCAEEEQRSIGRMFQGLGAAFQGNHQPAYPSQPPGRPSIVISPIVARPSR